MLSDTVILTWFECFLRPFLQERPCWVLVTLLCLTFVCPCIVSIIVNDDQQDATILAYLFIPNQLYVFRAMSSPIIWST